MEKEKTRYTVKEAAKLLEISEQAVRLTLQQKVADYGYAIKMKNWRYVIPKARLDAYLLKERESDK